MSLLLTSFFVWRFLECMYWTKILCIYMKICNRYITGALSSQPQTQPAREFMARTMSWMRNFMHNALHVNTTASIREIDHFPFIFYPMASPSNRARSTHQCQHIDAIGPRITTKIRHDASMMQRTDYLPHYREDVQIGDNHDRLEESINSGFGLQKVLPLSRSSQIRWLFRVKDINVSHFGSCNEIPRPVVSRGQSGCINKHLNTQCLSKHVPTSKC
jgi:hypothetical protein